MPNNSLVTVIGHQNPDTDSICSAISYAYLKNKTDGDYFVAGRSGAVNPETQFVLDRFGIDAPEFVDDVRQRVRNIEINKLAGIDRNLSLKKAWEYMHEKKAVTLAIVDGNGKLCGLISQGDITTSYMEVYDSSIISKAETPYKNLIECVNGRMIVGNSDDKITQGKVLIAAANPDVMEQLIKEGDVVLVGNRYESQLCAILMKAGCLVLANDAAPSETIKQMAEANNCKIISSPYDTYTVARLINQSLPVGYFMKSGQLHSFTFDDFLDDVTEVMTTERHRYFPVLDEHGRYAGMISRRNLILADKNQLILVDHNEKSQAVPGFEAAEILEIIDHHRIGSIETLGPVYFRNQPVGCTATIVTQMYEESGVEIPASIAGILLSAILSDTLAFRSPTCTAIDKVCASKLAKIAGIEDIEAYACDMFAAGSNLKNSTAEEIFFMDFKKFKSGSTDFGVGQISSMSDSELEGAKEKLVAEMPGFLAAQGCQMLFFMLTNIMKESSEVIYCGEDAEKLVNIGFETGEELKGLMTGTVNLEGVVSRKKQMIPKLMGAFSQL